MDAFTLAELTYDRMPDSLWPVLRHGSPEAAALSQCEAAIRTFDMRIACQRETIDRLEAQGRSAAHLMGDLGLYERSRLHWVGEAQKYRRALAGMAMHEAAE